MSEDEAILISDDDPLLDEVDDYLLDGADNDGAKADEIALAAIESKISSIEDQIEKLADQKATLRAQRQVIQNRREERIRHAKFEKNSEEIKNRSGKQHKCDPQVEEKLKTLAKEYFNISSFRPLQLETMTTSLREQDCILIMSTGGGKSLTFQLPALLTGGITIVVSPLISLMEDQVSGLKKFGISVVMVTGSMSQEQQSLVHKEMTCKTSNLRLVYVTPEKISKSKRFQNAMEKCYEMGLLKRVVIDEVHCVSQWGHDFRTDYKILGTLKRQYPDTPILGLTATATERVVADIRATLQLHRCQVFRASFNRNNLVYEVHSKAPTPGAIAEQVAQLIKGRFAGQSGLVYCYSRSDCEGLMAALSKYNLSVAYYHAALSPEDRKRVHHQWLRNEIQCIVATVAFGMGIDKPDVRFIIHHNMSKSIENYYQESGRAGRDGKKSYCILLFQPADLFKMTVMTCQESTGTAKSYEMLRYCITSTCRRIALANFFGEKFEAADCKAMCDKCQTKAKMVSHDVTYYAKEVLNCISNAVKKDLTFAMLMAEWKSKRSEKTRKLSVSNMEKVVIQMLADNILEEKFKAGMFKPYSYCKPGGFARSVLVGSKPVLMDIPSEEQPQFVAKPNSSPPSTKRQTTTTTSVKTKSVLHTLKTEAPAKKRKAAIVFESDSD